MFRLGFKFKLVSEFKMERTFSQLKTSQVSWEVALNFKRLVSRGRVTSAGARARAGQQVQRPGLRAL